MRKTDDKIIVENLEFRIFHQSHNGIASFPLLHTHGFSEVFLCLSETLTVATETSDVTLSAGEILLVPKGLVHCLVNASGQWESVCVELSRHRCTNRTANNEKNGKYNRPSGWYHRFSDLLGQLYHLKDRPDLCRELAEILTNPVSLAGISAMRCLSVLSKFPMEETEKTARDEKTVKVDLVMMTEIEQRIDNVGKPVSVTELAQSLHISVRQLERIIQNRYGCTFHEAVTLRRIRAAQTLLITCRKSISEIRDLVGYSETKTFYRAFRRVSGTTPMQYRKQNLSNHSSDKANP